MCIYRCFVFSPSWTSHLHCRTLQEKRGGAQIDLHQASTYTCMRCQKGRGTPPLHRGDTYTQTNTHIKSTRTRKTAQGALFTFRFKTLISSVHCQFLLFLRWWNVQNKSQCTKLNRRVHCVSVLNNTSRRLSRVAMSKALDWQVYRMDEWSSKGKDSPHQGGRKTKREGMDAEEGGGQKGQAADKWEEKKGEKHI